MLRKNFCFLSGWKRIFRFATPLEGSAGSKLNQQVVFIHEFTIRHRVSWWKFSTGRLEFNGKSFHASSLHLIAFLKHPPWKRDWLWWSGREENKFPSLLSIKIQIQKVKNWFFLLISFPALPKKIESFFIIIIYFTTPKIKTFSGNRAPSAIPKKIRE